MPASTPVPSARELLTQVGRSRAERTRGADERLRSLLADALTATETTASGVCVVALGGYGREELSAASDLDVLLLHDDRCPDVAAIAERLWYPLWDDRIALDHSVRTLDETLTAAAGDLRSALSLLDARHVAGDAALTIQLRTTLLAAWRRTAPRRLPELEESVRERGDRVGEIAALLEPDLKEARGGLRDGVVLRALAATWLVEVPQANAARIREGLLDVRDVLHEVCGRRPTDRLLADLQADVAAGLGLADRDALLRHVYQLGRTMSHLSDVTWRRVGRALAGRSVRRGARSRQRPGPVLTPVAPGVASVDGEVVLAPDARLGTDPMLPLRAAYAAADRGLLLAPHTADRLAGAHRPLPTPWPDEARRLFTALLGAGPDLLPVWEACDQAGLVADLVPEWDRVRCAPQYSPVHRHTVDRHLLDTCVQAARLVRWVYRPDLLLVAALLHDMGKGDGSPDHSVTGARIAARLAPRWGFDADDTATLVLLVRHHLLLADTATRRDLDDPTTIKQVAAVVRDADTLELLAALTEADARATGSAAWTPWRAALVERLVDRVRRTLERGQLPQPGPLATWQRLLAQRGGLDVVIEPREGGEVGASQLTVVAPDQMGLLATVAGVLALARLSVRSASVHTLDGMGVSIWSVSGDPPERAVLRERLTAALAGGTDLADRLAGLDAAYATSSKGRTRRRGGVGTAGAGPVGAAQNGAGADAASADGADVAAAQVRVVGGASTAATVLEVRAHDRPGLFHHVCAVLAAAGCSVRSAHVSTWADNAVDVFYLTRPEGGPLADTTAAEISRSVRKSLA
ncbi:[protein-PII] uridylyltransferase [Actinopolymorpha pittospori]|uniref:Bifunctional uridylyltransferase/uridylyl-removing enzyme n=1 Tax=Actinopolymorpha pittospori TaxID=648752 RepID=A0A927RCI7_9ACTN|nr:[protein-PII] uridylyltransferase [Actinopolymorpha pittospori]MBE1611312.1 [protein-PII] uridylyltransferase [Actinopolymorpha pittospori]